MSAFPSDDDDFDATYAEEAAMVDASEMLADLLEKSGMSRADLARALGVSRSEITERLRGERNITVRKLAASVHALGHRLSLTTEEKVATSKADPYAGWLSRTGRSYSNSEAHHGTVRVHVRSNLSRLTDKARAS